jgi:acetyl/propionyl-CoA carboxylase alpha subunit
LESDTHLALRHGPDTTEFPATPSSRGEAPRVAEGDVIGLVEVMKQFTEVQADASGKIVRFLIDNEAAVEPGQAVLLIETA